MINDDDNDDGTATTLTRVEYSFEPFFLENVVSIEKNVKSSNYRHQHNIHKLYEKI